MNVLFVDPDDGVAENVGAMLRRKGHACETVGKGERALALVQQGSYDIVVLEIDLPDMDGFDVIQRLKADRIETPVLLQSGHLGKSLTVKAAALQGMEIFAKPYIVTELIKRMEQVVALAEEQASSFQDELGDYKNRAAPEAGLDAGFNGSGSGNDKAGQGGERRDDQRKQFIEAALISDVSGPIPCVILDISRGGAALKLPEADRACPSLFTLELLDGPVQRCEMRWRKGDRIGVAFV
jgi:CheY-like chemotaxis protein